jgi:hypothetical protein
MSEQLPPAPAPVPMPVPTPVPAGDKKGIAIASLIIGILSLCASLGWYCGAPLSIVGLILGFLSVKSSGKGMAIAGIILSAVGLLLTIIFFIVGRISGPIIQQYFNQIISNSGY